PTAALLVAARTASRKVSWPSAVGAPSARLLTRYAVGTRRSSRTSRRRRTGRTALRARPPRGRDWVFGETYPRVNQARSVMASPKSRGKGAGLPTQVSRPPPAGGRRSRTMQATVAAALLGGATRRRGKACRPPRSTSEGGQGLRAHAPRDQRLSLPAPRGL